MPRRDARVLVRAKLRLICAGIAALAIGFALGVQANAPDVPAVATVYPAGFELQAAYASPVPDGPRLRLASLETGIASDSTIEDEEIAYGSAALSAAHASLRLFFDPRSASFGERFAAATAPVS